MLQQAKKKRGKEKERIHKDFRKELIFHLSMRLA